MTPEEQARIYANQAGTLAGRKLSGNPADTSPVYPVTASGYPITSASLTQSPEIKVPVPKPDTTDYKGVVANGVGQIADLRKQMEKAYSESGGTATPETISIQNMLTNFLQEGVNVPSGAAQYDIATGTTTESRALEKKQAEEEARLSKSRVRAAQAEVAGIQAQIQSITDQRDAQVLQLEQTINQGATGVGGAGALASGSYLYVRQQEINRQAAIKALPLQGLALAAQAKLMGLQGLAADAQDTLKAAQDKFNLAFQLKIDDNNRIYDAQKENRKMNWEYLTTKEKDIASNLERQQASNLSRANAAVNDAQILARSVSTSQADMAAALIGIPTPNPVSKTFENDLLIYNQSVAAIAEQIKLKAIAPRTEVQIIDGQKVLINSDTGDTIKVLGTAGTGGVGNGILLENIGGENTIGLFTPSSSLTAVQKLKVNTVVSGIDLINQAEKLYNEAVGKEYQGFGAGVISRLKGATRWTGAMLGTNQKWKAYRNFLDSNRAPIAKGIKGEVGNLAQNEQINALKSFPFAGTSPYEASVAFEAIRSQALSSVRTLGTLDIVNKQETNLISQPDGTQWVDNGDGTMTQVQ